MSTYQHDLSTYEITMLRRALGFYVKAYDEMKAATKVPHEKKENQEYIDAAVELDRKLLTKGKLVPE